MWVSPVAGLNTLRLPSSWPWNPKSLAPVHMSFPSCSPTPAAGTALLYVHTYTQKCTPRQTPTLCTPWVSLVPAPVPQPQPHGRAVRQPSHTGAHGTGSPHPRKLSKMDFNEETEEAALADTGSARHVD